MKRFLLALCIFCILLGFQSKAMAFNFYIDGFGDLSYMGSTQFGGGLALAGDITRDLKGIFRFSNSSVTNSPNSTNMAGTTKPKKEEFNSMRALFGVEYVYPVIPRVGWRSSAMIGFNSMNIGDYDGISAAWYWKEKDDTGMMTEIFTGIEYHLSQHVMPFVDLGYHYTYFSNELSDKTITGFTILMGVRVSIFGNTSIGENY